MIESFTIKEINGIKDWINHRKHTVNNKEKILALDELSRDCQIALRAIQKYNIAGHQSYDTENAIFQIINSIRNKQKRLM